MNLPTDDRAEVAIVQAVHDLEKIARNLARRGFMVSGYMSIHIGAGNPDCFYKIIHQQDGYHDSGWAKTGSEGVIIVEAPTLPEAVEKLKAALPQPPKLEFTPDPECQ